MDTSYNIVQGNSTSDLDVFARQIIRNLKTYGDKMAVTETVNNMAFSLTCTQLPQNTRN